MKIIILITALCASVYSEVGIELGHGDVLWGDSVDKLKELYPKPLGLVKARNNKGMYIVSQNKAYILVEKTVIGIRLGSVLDSRVLAIMGMPYGRDGEPLGYGLTQDMKWSEVKEALNIPDSKKADYRVSHAYKGMNISLEFSSRSGISGDDKYNLSGLTILCERLNDGQDGGLNIQDGQGLF